VLGYRGTDVKKGGDIMTDVRLAGAGWDHEGDPRFDAALDQYDAFARTYHSYNDTSVTGHSLGGSQAMWVATKHPEANTMIFNAGVVSPTGGQSIRTTLGVDDGMGKPLNNVTLLRVDGDLVSGGWMSYANPEELKDENGDALVSWKDPEHKGAVVRAVQSVLPERWINQYPKGEGLKLVNVKGEDESFTWAHAMSNFLTGDQSRKLGEARDAATPQYSSKSMTHAPDLGAPPTYHYNLATDQVAMDRPNMYTGWSSNGPV
jgi:pimeloyl-ACP methyl ester carboxylesterase